MRGKDTLVTCDQCSRRVPRTKAVDFEKRFSYGTELHNENDVRSMMFSRKVYYCISCAKHRGIFEKKKQAAERAAHRFD